MRYFSTVRSEYKSSLFIKSAQVKIKEINAYLKLSKEYEVWLNAASLKDSIDYNSDIKNQENISKMLYGLAELEALHFSNNDSAIVFLDELINLETKSKLFSKALYMKSVILENLNNYDDSKIIKQLIIDEYPQSDYAYAIMKSDPAFSSKQKTSYDILIKAEKQWDKNQILALDVYKSIVNSDTTSESGLNAAYFLAYNYDYYFTRPDSAKKFYDWIIKYHNSSDQAKPSKVRLAFITKILNDNNKQ